MEWRVCSVCEASNLVSLMFLCCHTNIWVTLYQYSMTQYKFHTKHVDVFYVHSNPSQQLQSPLKKTFGSRCHALTSNVPAVTTTFVCSEPEDGLAPDNDHRQYPLCSLGRLQTCSRLCRLS